MTEKHLHELLKEEQEPFVLKNYINERRCQLKRPVHQTQLQPKRRKPISRRPTFSSNFRKNPCFLPFFDSDPRKSPLFDFHSPPKTPCRNSNTFFVNIPSRTAALLLESALRIEKQSSSSSKQKNPGFGFFGSVLKRIAFRKKTQKREICGKENPISLKDILKWDSLPEFAERTENALQVYAFPEDKGIPNLEFSCSCEMSDWWKGLEEKSEDLESSSSRSSRSWLEDFEDMEIIGERDEEFRSYEKGVCSSPFRFRGVEDWPDSGFRTPEFGSPVDSRACRKTEVVGSQLFPRTVGAADGQKEYEAEEENEQLSPASVLDAPFEDQDEDEDEDGCFHHQFEHSLANVQKVKHQLLNKIRRFERLAALDPLELEKIIAQEEEEDDDDDDDDNSNNSENSEREVESLVALEYEKTDEFVRKALVSSDSDRLHGRIPTKTKRLVLDLVEEEREDEAVDREVLVKRVCKKIESWKNVESNTIDMTVELDFRRECDEWLRNPNEVQEIAIKVAFVIFSSLVDELLIDLTW